MGQSRAEEAAGLRHWESNKQSVLWQSILSEPRSAAAGPFPPGLFFTLIVSQLQSGLLLKMGSYIQKGHWKSSVDGDG